MVRSILYVPETTKVHTVKGVQTITAECHCAPLTSNWKEGSASLGQHALITSDLL